jgi:hypothetical protein
MSEGIISGIRNLDGAGRLLQTTAAISHGSSGGGLFDAQRRPAESHSSNGCERYRSRMHDGRTLEHWCGAEENNCMNTVSFDLLFLSSEEIALPSHPIARVFVKSSSGTNYGEGKSFVSNECASYREFSAEIDRLQGELERLRLSARLQFDKECERING